jgi:hypothetical protein
MAFFWWIRCMLEKSRPFTSSVMRRESTVLKSLKKQQANTNSSSWQGKLHGGIERVHLQIGLETGISSIDWAQLSRFHLKTETESSLWSAVFWKINRTVFFDKDRTMDNVQKHNICTNKCNFATLPCDQTRKEETYLFSTCKGKYCSNTFQWKYLKNVIKQQTL